MVKQKLHKVIVTSLDPTEGPDESIRDSIHAAINDSVIYYSQTSMLCREALILLLAKWLSYPNLEKHYTPNLDFIGNSLRTIFTKGDDIETKKAKTAKTAKTAKKEEISDSKKAKKAKKEEISDSETLDFDPETPPGDGNKTQWNKDVTAWLLSYVQTRIRGIPKCRAPNNFGCIAGEVARQCAHDFKQYVYRNLRLFMGYRYHTLLGEIGIPSETKTEWSNRGKLKKKLQGLTCGDGKSWNRNVEFDPRDIPLL